MDDLLVLHKPTDTMATLERVNVAAQIAVIRWHEGTPDGYKAETAVVRAESIDPKGIGYWPWLQDDTTKEWADNPQPESYPDELPAPPTPTPSPAGSSLGVEDQAVQEIADSLEGHTLNKWRVGKSYGIHVYDTETGMSVATFHNPVEAKAMVAVWNTFIDGMTD